MKQQAMQQGDGLLVGSCEHMLASKSCCAVLLSLLLIGAVADVRVRTPA
jgi:hypothetical protein